MNQPKAALQHKMTATGFDIALRRIRHSGAKRYLAARAVMVGGESIASASRAFGVSRQHVYDAMNRIKAQHALLGVCPVCGQPLPHRAGKHA